MPELVYNDRFYKNRDNDTEYAAAVIMGLLVKRLRTAPKSVVDVGCGVGTWLRVAQTKYSVTTAVGLDGDYVPRKYLQIRKSQFMSCDLETYCVEEVLARQRDGGKFDIAVCLEVAEHIRRQKAAEFIHKLCQLSDIICFSAAIPQQGGEMHVNEQRLSYWAELFQKNNYRMCDAIRSDIWNDRKIPVWYRENTVIFYNAENAETHIVLENIRAVVDMVHPDLFERKVCLYEKQIREMQKNRTIKALLREELCRITKKIKNFRSSYLR